MKKILFIILSIICFTGIVNAEKCTIISGTGTNIGDEIDCAGERFYIIKNNEDTVKALAKYNLYYGKIYDRTTEEFTTVNKLTATYSYSSSNTEYNLQMGAIQSEMYQNCLAKGFGNYYKYPEKNADNTFNYYCYEYESIDVNSIKQDERAVGAHGTVPGQPEYPLVALDEEYIHGSGVLFTSKEATDGEPYFDFDRYACQWGYDEGYYDCFERYPYIAEYKETLESLNINVIDMDIITVSEINEIVKSVANRDLPLDEWAENWEDLGNIMPTEWEVYKVGSIKDYIDSKYSWLWSTTYWTRTVAVEHYSEPKIDAGSLTGYVYFVDTLGNLCSTYTCNNMVGAGMRPVLTIEKEQIEYEIKTETDGNGQIKVEKEIAAGGEVIRFTVEPAEGYVLGELKVIDADGNVINVESNSFTMPNANVTIVASFVKINPNTSDIALTLALTGLIVSGILMVYSYKKKSEL